jgi:hypothetical protein
MENNSLALYPTNFRSGSDSVLNVDHNVIIGSIPGGTGMGPIRASCIAAGTSTVVVPSCIGELALERADESQLFEPVQRLVLVPRRLREQDQ